MHEIIPEGASPLRAGRHPEPLVSRKLVYREVSREGSETTNYGADEQS